MQIQKGDPKMTVELEGAIKNVQEKLETTAQIT
jgi:hypothetical protein